ncbi:MAG: hypothetical protein ACREIV_03515 [Planctomycetaceae bacterium]
MSTAVIARPQQAIAGVSPSAESVIMIVYPSVASTGVGRLLGRVIDAIPLKIMGIKLSHLLFALPLSPLALLMYAWLKVAGVRYVLTNRSIQRWRSLGSRMLRAVPLAEIDRINVVEQPGQAFYKAADLRVLRADGSVAMELAGIARADVFRQIILEARDARRQTEQALATIQARKGA